MKQQQKSQVSSGGRGPGFALLLAKVLTNGLREWQRNAGGETKKCNGVIMPKMVQCAVELRDLK